MLNISVIIPVYNAALFVEKAVNSALQFDEVQEILLIEDKSSDNSLSVCQNLAEKNPKIKLFQHPDKGNHGAGATRNLGLEKATQEYIAFLDADDYWLPNRFEAEKEIFKDSKIEGVFGAIGTEFLTEKGRAEFQEKFKDTTLTTVKKNAEGEDVFLGLIDPSRKFGSFFSLIALTVRKSAIERVHLRFNENLRVHQDTDFIVKLSYHCYLKSGNITEAVAMRGVHDENRITKIKMYSPQYKERQLLLWKSIDKWSIDKRIEKKFKEHIHLQQKSYELSTVSGLTKILKTAVAVFLNPKILKTRYRFLYLT